MAAGSLFTDQLLPAFRAVMPISAQNKVKNG
jgi:hypothetical protein